jgi:hypothetical protein
VRLCIPNLEPAPFGTLKVRGPRKHAFAPRAFAHPENRPSSWRATARQRGFCPSRWLRHASVTPDAGDDPVNEEDPTGDVSVGFCAGFEVHIVFVQLGAGDCLTAIVNGQRAGEIGIAGTPIEGLGLGLSAGVQYYVQVSNADSLDELSSWFTYFAATAAFGGGVEGTFFWNNHWSGRIILGGDVGVEAGAGLSGALGESYTWVKVINGWFGVAADAAHVAYDAMKLLAPGFNATSVLNRARAIADQYGPGVHGSSCPK